MADVSKTVAIIFEGQDKTSAAIGNIEKTLQGVGNEAGTASTKVDQLDSELQQVGGNTKGIEAATNALKALAASLVAKAFIDANVEAEKFDRTMTLLKGSSSAAATEFEYVKRTAETLGLELFTVANAYASLSASTKGTSLEGQATRDVFEAVSKAMAALGKSSADTEGALLAISQIVSKGTVSLEELRGQLGERLPGAFQIAARSMGVTTQELDKLVSTGKLTAEQFLPGFAAELEKTFGSASFDGYTAAMNRLRNTLSETFVELGKAGAFDILIRGIEAVTATVTGAVSTIRLLGETAANLAFSLLENDWSGFGDRFQESLDKAAAGTKSLTDALIGSREEASGLNTAAKDVEKTVSGMAANPAIRGDMILVDLKKTLKEIKDDDTLSKVSADIVTQFAQGKLTAEQFAEATKMLDGAQERLAGTMPKTKSSAEDATKALAKQAEETRKAEEAAAKFAIEMEKIASNERIKFIEAKVALNVAQVEADAEKVKAAFESISGTVESTGDVLNTLFGLFKDYSTLDWAAIRTIEDQIDKENDRRDKALDLQKRLTEAQIDLMRAQIEQYESGDALVKIDGAGLQPHLEAFMWEILKAIQVRVNRDGLGLLLGV